MRRMAKVVGRSDDMLIIRGVNVFPSQIEEQILKVAGLSPHYQLEVTREAHLDALAVNVECDPGDMRGAEASELCARELVRLVKSYIGISVRVATHPPGTIERSVGKAKRVVDRRPR
jgi:phenylacetate-CoA ligase